MVFSAHSTFMKLTQYLHGFVMLSSENTRLIEIKKKQCNPALHTGNAYNIKPGMRDTERFIALTEREMEYLFRIIDSSTSITQRHQFFLWAQGDVDYREKLEGQPPGTLNQLILLREFNGNGRR